MAVVALSLCAVACRTPAAPETTLSSVDTMSFEPDWTILQIDAGDVLRVIVRGHADLSSPPDGSVVDEFGAVTLPLVGAVDVRGKSTSDAGAAVRAAYSEYLKDPDVTTALVRRESKRFHVLGQIREPGPYPLTQPLTALEALSHGGFFLNAADRRRVFLLRPHGPELEVHEFSAATPSTEGLVQVRPGDVLFVRRRGTQRFQEEVLPLLAPLYSIAPTAVALDAID